VRALSWLPPWLWPALLAGLLLAVRPAAGAEPGSGLVVESVVPPSAAAAAGIEPGDLLLRWTVQSRDPVEPPQAGTLDTPFDLFDLLIESVPSGEVDLAGSRQGRPFTWRLRSTGSLVLGIGLRLAKDTDRAAESPRLAAWRRLRSAEVALAAGDAPVAEEAFSEVSEILRRASDPAAHATALMLWAYHSVEKGELGRAREQFEQALALERERQGADLAVAFFVGILAHLSDQQEDYPAAERQWLERLEILERTIPDSPEVARTLDFLGYLALWRGDNASAQERLSRSEALQRSISTTSLEYATTLDKLALLAQDAGDLERAEALQRRVLALDEQLIPDSPDHSGALMNLAVTLSLRGELAAAEDLLHRVVEQLEKSGDNSQDTAAPYTNLGELALYRGDLAAAQSYFESALSRLTTDPQRVLPQLYIDLAEVARRQRRFAAAHAWEEKALVLTEPLALGDLGRAARLSTLARIEQEDGRLGEAEALLRQAVTAAHKFSSEGIQANAALRDLGRLLVRTGRPAEAEALYRQVLANLDRHGFAGTKEEAEAQNLLGEALRRRGDLPAAEASYCRALQSLGLQRSRLGGSLEARAWFESDAASYAFDCLAARMARGRSAAAFQALEQGKSRVFLQLLAERDLRFAELPPELKAERERLDAEYDRILGKLAQAPPAPDERTRPRTRLEEIKAAREALLARLRQESPRLAALQAPEPVDLRAARHALDPGTVLLAYAVGPRESYLFVVRPGEEGGNGLQAYRLPVGRAALEKEIEAFRRLLVQPQSDVATLDARAARLYDRLVKPAEPSLRRARRILISADGPLHRLPWAALRRRHRYLVEQWPIHLTASTTVYGETRRGRRPAGDPGSWRLVALGDPEYPRRAKPEPQAFTDSEVRSVVRRGLNLEPLPATREEIEKIAALFPKAETFLGREATEEHAKQAAPRADLFHFAGHGLIDERFPLDSALALSLPAEVPEGRDNGLLQAWEILESMRLDAQLVTLSACDTALGREMGGEGILGLTRAFQFAGAHSVLASLWSVEDVSTAKLMERFYTYLRQGRSKDQALRAAQLDLIHSGAGDLAHPYHWAGFALYGDWR